MDVEAPQPFDCPRCRSSTEAPFYGPCRRCRAELVAAQVGLAREADAARFEPAMHVVPNQVATKE